MSYLFVCGFPHLVRFAVHLKLNGLGRFRCPVLPRLQGHNRVAQVLHHGVLLRILSRRHRALHRRGIGRRQTRLRMRQLIRACVCFARQCRGLVMLVLRLVRQLAGLFLRLGRGGVTRLVLTVFLLKSHQPLRKSTFLHPST